MLRISKSGGSQPSGGWRRSLGAAPVFAALLLLFFVLAAPIHISHAAEDEVFSEAELKQVRAAEAGRIAAIDRVYGAVVAIYGNDRGGGGSGVLYDPAGLALTNHHVVAAAGVEGWAGLADGKLYRWKLIGTDPGGDVAIIQLLGKESFPIAPLGDSGRVRIGDWAMAMGNPFVLAEDQRPTVTLGVVSGIERYQEGSGKNQLVYGNCIQVDSSINPGNSGGPLFSMRGEIIGINGRGSFKERGRVNVGLGYAISSAQVKNFLPDLLATKVAQHGTLDALFGNRGKEVICHTLNLDSPAAGQGLELGDKLLEFEGQKITNANQFTNIISTLPADWPVHLVYEHEGKRGELRVRLIALPYDTQQPADEPETPEEPPKKEGDPKKDEPKKDDPTPEAPKAEPASKPEDKPKSEAPKDEKPKEESPKEEESKEEKPKEEKPAEPPKGKPPMPIKLPRPAPKLPPTEPGKVRDEALNMVNARRLIDRWKANCGAASVGPALKGFKLTDDVVRGDKKVGTQTMILAADGRFRVDYAEADQAQAFGFDGENYWIKGSDGKVETVGAARALRTTLVSQAAVLSALFQKDPFSRYGKVLLESADKAQGRLAYRLKATDAEGEWHYFWLSVLGDNGQPEVALLKSGADSDNVGPNASVAYGDWREVQGVRLPHQRALVEGLAERVVVELKTVSGQSLDQVNDADFKVPTNVESNK